MFHSAEVYLDINEVLCDIYKLRRGDKWATPYIIGKLILKVPEAGVI